MHDRVRDLPKIGLSQQRRVVIFLLGLAGSLFFSSLAAEAKSDYEIIDTGIKGGGCWVDDNHFLVEKRVPRKGSQGSDLEGLYWLDPRHPDDLKPISLTLLEPSAQKRVWQVTCQDGKITFLVPGAKKGSSRLYSLRIGEAPELIVDMRAPRVSLQGKYVLGNSHRAAMDGGALQGAFEDNDDCLLADAKAGFKVLCWDWWLVIPQPLPQFVLTKYQYEERIKIRETNGQAKWVPNPELPLKLPDGKELKQGYLLRDLDNRIVQEIPMKQGPYQLIDISIKPDPLQKYLYGVCFKTGDHGDRFYTQGGRICRYLIDGTNRGWEEIVSIQKSPRDPFSLHDLDTNDQGDVVMIERGHRPAISLWKYAAHSKVAERLIHVVSPEDLRTPKVSPDGRWVGVMKNSHLLLIESKGAEP